MTQFDMNILKVISMVTATAVLVTLFFVITNVALTSFLGDSSNLAHRTTVAAAANELGAFRKINFGAIIAFSADLIEPFAFSLRGIFFPSIFFLIAFLAAISAFCFSPKFLAAGLSFVRGVGLDIFRGDRRFMVKFFIVFTSIFLIILTFNFTGLLAFNFTATGTLLTPLLLSLAVFGAAVTNLIKTNRVSLFAGFLPSGADLFIAPFISLIEIMSFVAKYVSLMVRLFANIFAGHLLLKTLYVALSAFVLAMNVLSFLGIALFAAFMVAIVFLETFIAFLQSLVFFVLTMMYYSESTEFTTAH